MLSLDLSVIEKYELKSPIIMMDLSSFPLYTLKLGYSVQTTLELLYYSGEIIPLIIVSTYFSFYWFKIFHPTSVSWEAILEI